MYWDSTLKQKWDNENVLQYAIQQAVKQAVEQAVKDTKETTLKQIATKAKAAGILPEIIAKCTGLSVAEIEKL